MAACHRNHHVAGDLRSLAIALGITVGIAAIQFIGSILSSSLALLSDSVHMVVDISSLAIAYVSLRLAQRRTVQHRLTFGWRRVEILAALLNGLVLLVLCGLIVWEAVERIASPRSVHTTPMLLTATIGVLANGVAWYLLRGTSHLTTRSAYLHVVNDLLSSLVVIVGGIAMSISGWTSLDPVLSIAITIFIARSGIGVIRRAIGILMESAPAHLDVESVRALLREHPDVRNVHDLHLWQIGATSHAMSAHVVVATSANRDQALRDLHAMLKDVFGIQHVTLQLEGEHFADSQECRGCEDHDPFSIDDEHSYPTY